MALLVVTNKLGRIDLDILQFKVFCLRLNLFTDFLKLIKRLKSTKSSWIILGLEMQSPKTKGREFIANEVIGVDNLIVSGECVFVYLVAQLPR